MQKLPKFFSKDISMYAIFNDQSFNDTLTNDIVSFEQPIQRPCSPIRSGVAFAIRLMNHCAQSSTIHQYFSTSRKHAYIILTPLNPTFI